MEGDRERCRQMERSGDRWRENEGDGKIWREMEERERDREVEGDDGR